MPVPVVNAVARDNREAMFVPCPVLLMKVVNGSVTVMSKSSLTVPPLPSLAFTFTDTVPTSAAAGVPAKVRVPGVKPSHVGSAMPSAFVAVYVSVWPVSVSLNVFVGNW